MMRATASAASAQVWATTRRVEAGPLRESVTTPVTDSDAVGKNCARTASPFSPSTKRTLGALLTTREIRSAREVHSGLASTSRRATAGVLGSAEATSGAFVHAIARSASATRRVLVDSDVNGSIG